VNGKSIAVNENLGALIANFLIIDPNFAFVNAQKPFVDGLWVVVDGFRWRLIRYLVQFMG